jgi:hypothetical protein
MGATGYLVIRDSASGKCHDRHIACGIFTKENRQAFGLPELEG